MKVLLVSVCFSVYAFGCCGSSSVETGSPKSPITSRSLAYSPTLVGSKSGPLAATDEFKARQVVEAYRRTHPKTVAALQAQSGRAGADAEIMRRHLRSGSRHISHAMVGMSTVLGDDHE